MIKLAIAAFLAMLVLGLVMAWVCCAVAGRADDEMDRICRDRIEDQ